MNTFWEIVIVVFLFLFMFFGGGLILLLHLIFEVGNQSAKTRYNVASIMLRLSRGNLNFLHKTLDVIIFGNTINSIPSGTSFHSQYWLLGHKTAEKILKHQEHLNIPLFWLAKDYKSALKEMEDYLQI